MNITEAQKTVAIEQLTMAIEAAQNSNDAGERAIMAGAQGVRLLGALKRLLPELRRAHEDGLISAQQLSDAEGSVAAAEGRLAGASSPPSPKIPAWAGMTDEKLQSYALIQEMTGLPLSIIRANMEP